MSSHRATSSAKSGGGDPALRPPADGQSHYQLLGLSPQATAAELRQAFRNLSKRYHPDTTTLPPTEAREAFARLRQAYAVLADPDSRRAYDAVLLQPSPPLVVPPSRPTAPAAAARPIGVRRSLSGGEWFALVLLGLALALSLVLGVGLAWARGAALVTRPSWWSDAAMPSATANPVLSTPEAAESEASGGAEVMEAPVVAAVPGSTAPAGAPPGGGSGRHPPSSLEPSGHPMATLPPDRTPLYHHPLPALEEWLRNLGARQRGAHAAIWDLHRPQWSATIELAVEDLQVSWYHDGQERLRHFPYGLARADVEAAILAGP